MGVVATITIGADNFSVYGLTADPVVDATSYFNGQLGTSSAAWTAASADDKKRSLVMAVRWIDRAARFSGTKTVANQPLEWPRDGATNVCTGLAIANSTVPDDIARAEFELAGLLLQDPGLVSNNNAGSNTKRLKAGSAEIEYFRSTDGKVGKFPTVAQGILKCYFGGSSFANFAGGTDGESWFDDCDDFELTRGL